MTLNDQLLQQAEKQVEGSDALVKCTAVCSKLMQALPRIFPEPDELYSRPDFEYDAALIYNLRKGERGESLRMILSVTFAATEWEGEKDGDFFNLRVLVKIDGLSLLLKIIGADPTEYKLSSPRQIGLKLIGTLVCTKFVPWEITRPDVTPAILLESCVRSNVGSYVASRQSQILSELAVVLPTLPQADEVSAALGLNYDADITYIQDPYGKKRQYLDKHLGYRGWAATVDKKTADFSLHTILDIKSKLGTIRLRVTIFSACQYREQLFLVADLPSMLIYRASRETDEDYTKVLQQFEGKYDD